MIIVLVFVVGLSLGSFINALVWRLHETEDRRQEAGDGKKRKKADSRLLSPDSSLSIISGRSMCVHCGHELAAKDLVPIISWLALKGKCRYCSKPIHWQYPLIEGLTALLFVLSYVYWPSELNAEGLFLLITWLIFLVGLIAITVYDIRWLIIPNKIVYPLIVGVLVQRVIQALIFVGDAAPIRDAVLGLLVGGGFFYAIFVVSKGRWIGGGDVKLGFFIGLLLGPSLSLLTIFVASLIGSLVSIILLLTKKVSRKQHVPFGPYLILGTFIAALWGQSIIDWYLDSGIGY